MTGYTINDIISHVKKVCYKLQHQLVALLILNARENIRAIHPHMKKREMGWKIIAMNIDRMIETLVWIRSKLFETESSRNKL